MDLRIAAVPVLLALLAACAPASDTAVVAEQVDCGGACGDFACFRDRYDCLVQHQTITDAFTDLKREYEASAVARTQCHQLVHVIGRAAVERYLDIVEAYRRGDHFCWSGYYHGVLERLIANAQRDGKDILGVMNAACDSVPGRDRYSFDYYNCVHGLGHGVMFLSGNDLNWSLATCDALDGQWERASCWSGAFMENVIADGFNHVTTYLSDDPHYPCNGVGDQYKTTCYLMQTSHMLKLARWDFKKVFGYCAGAEPAYVDTCYQSLGRDASGQTLSDIDRTRAYCLLGADFRQRANCVVGAAKDFISYFHSTEQASRLCASLPDEFKPTCTATVASYGATL